MRFFTSTAVFMSIILSLLGINISVDYTVNEPDTQWKQTVQQNYAEFIAETDGDENKIPFIISSDQHGTVSYDSGVFRFINDTVDWTKISKIINLGDTATLALDLWELEQYRLATACMPVEKRLEMCGNHDGHILLARADLSRYFPAYDAVGTNKNDAFVVEDEQFNIRYLSVDNMSYPWTYTSGRITEKQADFIVSVLESKDESDIVFLSHTYLFRDNLTKRDGTAFTGSEYFIGSEEKNTAVKQSFIDMLAARKNKTAGVFTDSDGKEHHYDFTGCKSDFLMTIHGHHHTEGYETYDGITEFLVQGFAKDNEEDNESNCFYFAYIDRQTKTFKCWKNIPGYDAWEISIA